MDWNEPEGCSVVSPRLAWGNERLPLWLGHEDSTSRLVETVHYNTLNVLFRTTYLIHNA